MQHTIKKKSTKCQLHANTNFFLKKVIQPIIQHMEKRAMNELCLVPTTQI